jgi:glycosyltransferase involved in cell wall biosynthesis/2-polyprenyl-3-methyl-5-hydroxy-6-metoxy-1,4-benzoquinol methylase
METQRRTESGPPYLSWCLVVRNCADTLETTLRSLRERTPEAEIVVVDTMSSDDTPHIARPYADVWTEYRGPRGDWDREMPWVDAMASARQRSFDLASGRWRAWIDGDDRLPGPEEVERLLKLNRQWKPQRSGQRVEPGADEPQDLADVLRDLEAKHPSATLVHAPYLYQRDEHDQAVVWQVRERICRWGDGQQFRWAEEAHEVLVPVGPKYPPRVEMSGLLFVHEKRFTGDAYDYSIRRHFAVLDGLFQKGDRNTRRCLYLANYARFLCPERELEFLDAAHDVAVAELERYRALVALGNYYAERGLMRDARERFGAAKALRPNVPDAHMADGIWASAARDYVRAVDAFERGVACEVTPETEIAPRHHAIRYPTMLSVELQRLGTALCRAGAHTAALDAFTRATHYARRVMEDESIGADRDEAIARWRHTDNRRAAEHQALAIDELWRYLVASDEPLKARALLGAVPHNLQDHPLVRRIEKWSERVARHAEDPDAYRDFYQNVQETGLKPLEPARLVLEHAELRIRWLVAWIKAKVPRGRILEVGPCDGGIAIPLLRECPEIRYHGLELSHDAAEMLRRNLDTYELADRATVMEGALSWSFVHNHRAAYDAIIFAEVIEHVPNVILALDQLHALMAPDGYLLITTPWGSFDAGHPPQKTAYGTPRDERGHLRAMTARDLVTELRDAGIYPVDVMRIGDETSLGNALVAAARHRKVTAPRRAAAFCVAGALWDWHSRSVEREGIGASEEMIIFLARALTADDRTVEVYGPVPDPDTHWAVNYWPREQLRRAPRDATFIVSRAPQYFAKVDEEVGASARKVLWLQDAWYPELSAEVAEHYDTIVCVSDWHRGAMCELHGVPLSKMETLYNFLLPAHFTGEAPPRKRDHFVYASSPDRGLVKLLELWPRILERYPDATLDVFYGWRGCAVLGAGTDAAWIKRFEDARRRFEALRHQKGVQLRGMVPHAQIALELRRAGVWAYPVLGFSETCCTNALKARAAGAVPVTTALAALCETANCEQATLVPPDDPDYDERFLEGVRRAVEMPDADRERMSRQALETYALERFLPRWREIVGG